MISFGKPFYFWYPSPFPGGYHQRHSHVVAPYWTDNDIHRGGEVYYETFIRGRSESEDTILDKVNQYIGLNTEQNFSGTFMILAEWRDVHHYPHGSCSLCYFLRRYPSMRSFMNQVWLVMGLMTMYVS